MPASRPTGATGPTPSAQQQAIYRAVLQEAAVGGEVLMGKLVASARTALQTREAACRDLRERDALAQSAALLRRQESALCKHFPQSLVEAFNAPVVQGKPAPKNDNALNFDQLELMDEVQVLTSVALGRTQQVAMLATEASLADLNTLVCGILGLGAVQPERNPLRPEIYVAALKSTLAHAGAPAASQLDWLTAMSATLGQELKALYTALSASLRTKGVVPAGYAMLQTPSGPGIGRGVAQESAQGESPSAAATGGAASAPAGRAGVRLRGNDEALLTLDKLRRLLAGELDIAAPVSKVEHFAQQFARQFENGPEPVGEPVSEFDATVPAALEALTEMKQVDRVVQSLQQRKAAPAGAAGGAGAQGNSLEDQRLSIRRGAKNLAQALSLEVVTLMVDNMARDPRLLPPVQALIRKLEPSLLRLALADPRFFSDKQHPARQLLQEFTHRSLAFESPASSGFDGFIRELEAAVAPLFTTTMDDDAPYLQVLAGLQDAWQRAAQQKARDSEQAVFVLQHAEARNLLAEKIARSIDAHPDAGRVPPVVIDFLCGPWAQVVAQARIQGGTGSTVADKYQALISALLWSAHPDLARQNVSKLTKLVPRLLGTLREGLDSIHYPATRTSAFFEALMAIHQQAFRTPDVAPAEPSATPDADRVSSLRARFVEQGDPWIAPEEAQSSNFVEIAEAPEILAATNAPATPTAPSPAQPQSLDAAVDELPLGSWIELLTKGQWVRTQLTWASPHGTLFLFTSAVGATQSMTRRSRDKLIAAGQMRLISGQPVVDGALNAVAQTAMRNSLDSTQ